MKLYSSTDAAGNKHVWTPDKRLELQVTDTEMWGEIIRRVNGCEAARDVLAICEYALEQYLDDGCEINRQGLVGALKKAQAVLKGAP